MFLLKPYSLTSRLYNKGVDEQLIMERTGHSSIDGIRSYKRTLAEQVMCLSDIFNNPTGNGNNIKRNQVNLTFNMICQSYSSVAVQIFQSLSTITTELIVSLLMHTE